MCLDGDPVVWLIAIVRRGWFGLVINRLTTVHTDCVLSFVSLEALHSHSFPCRRPSRIAHAYLQTKAGACWPPRCHDLYSAIGVRYNSAGRRRSCSPARTAYAPARPFTNLQASAERYICNKRAPPRWRRRRPKQERILWLILFCVSLYYTILLSAMDCRICSRLLSARPCR